MKNLSNIVPKIENKEVKKELSAIPIFRNNDLYSDLFPEIEPTFEKGEEPTIKKILASILRYKNSNIILDKTCSDVLFYPNISKVNLADFPEEFELKEIPLYSENNEVVDTGKIIKILKDKFNISIILDEDDGFFPVTIDQKIFESIGRKFSEELVEGLFEIAKHKNKNIKKIYILTNRITDHTYFGEDEKNKVIQVLKEEAQKCFNIDPLVIENMNESEIMEGDHIIADRHNPLVFEAVKQKPTQFSVLPIETELHNNELYLESKPEQKGIVSLLRKEFEKEESK